MALIRTFLTWLDKHALFIVSVFLLAFIPLFPKIPLFDALPGYIVRVRIEDILVFLTMLIWVRELWLGRIQMRSLYIWGIVSYIIVGFISLILGIFLLESIPLELLHIGKSVLHYFRYIEYFLLFIIAYSAIRTQHQIKIVITVLCITVFGIALYGYGQQHWQLPLYSTMNREYSKGVALYLQEFARPQSTFAGPYDLGAFLAFVLPFLFSLLIVQLQDKKTRFKYLTGLLALAQASGLWMLIASGAKTALAAYCAGIAVVVLLKLSSQKSYLKQTLWGGGALLGLLLLVVIIIQFSGTTTRDYLRTLSAQNRVTHTAYSLVAFESIESAIPSLGDRPSDLYGAGHEIKRVATESADGVAGYIDVPTKSIWSDNALKYGISMGIRLDTLWPNAIKGFFANPLTGKGYGTLAKTESQQFTEADSTDNNYLRVLGETGLLGFIAFFGSIFILLRQLFHTKASTNALQSALSIGLAAGVSAMLINALYIDVFAASKVAFTFWGLAGFVVATNQLLQSSNLQSKKPSESLKHNDNFLHSTFEKNIFGSIKDHITRHSSVYLALLILFFMMHQNPFADNTLLKNIGDTPSAVEEVVAARCYLAGLDMTICNTQTGILLKSHHSIYSYLLVPFLSVAKVPTAFYFANATILVISLLITYGLVQVSLVKWPKNRTLRMLIGLGTTLLLIRFLSNSEQPFTTTETIIFLLGIPIVAIAMSISTSVLTSKTSTAVRNGFLVFATLSLLASAPLSSLSTRFRNDQIPHKYKAIERINLSFDENFVVQNQSKPYVITTLNPYYIDLYNTGGTYLPLPLTRFQSYFDHASAAWGDSDYNDLMGTYSDVLETEHRLFISDYGLDSDPANQAAFDQIANDYSLRFHAIDCDERCNLYSITPKTAQISPQPQSINPYILNLNQLSSNENGYEFRIFSNRYNSDLPSIKHNTRTYAQRVAEASSQPSQFSIVTGDTGVRGDGGQWEYFLQLTEATHNYPLLYSPGNFDVIPRKYASTTTQIFYTERDFFILAPVKNNSTIDPVDQLDIYNALLSIESMPEIKNVFLIAHDLDWQSNSSDQNFLPRLENRINRLTDKKVYIFTSDHTPQTAKPNQQYEQLIKNAPVHIEYNASLISGTQNDIYLEIKVDQTGAVLISPQSLPLLSEQIELLNSTVQDTSE